VNDPCHSTNNATVDGALAFQYSTVQPILAPYRDTPPDPKYNMPPAPAKRRRPFLWRNHGADPATLLSWTVALDERRVNETIGGRPVELDQVAS
jgi:hypothetical protein